EWDRWLLMGLIGAAVRVLGSLIYQIINSLIKLKWNLVENYLQVSKRRSDIFCVCSLENPQCQFFCPAASPFGLPEIIGYLNCTSIQHLSNIMAFLGTFLSCMLAVAYWLLHEPEGPMIHLG
ncbi:CLCD protein, partial [Grantiella picta]|nr:CLCD protein [Grantiella picta]